MKFLFKGSPFQVYDCTRLKNTLSKPTCRFFIFFLIKSGCVKSSLAWDSRDLLYGSCQASLSAINTCFRGFVLQVRQRVCHTCPEIMMSLFWVGGETCWTYVSVNLKHTFVAVNMSCQLNTLCYVNFVMTGDCLQSCVKRQFWVKFCD